MRRILSVFTVTAVMVALAAAPVLAQDLDGDDFTNDELLFVEQDSALFDALCSPFTEIDLAGCIFSDEDEEVVLSEGAFVDSDFDGFDSDSFDSEFEVEDVEFDSQDVFQGVEDVENSIVQNGAASISVGDEFEVDQTVSDFQNATVTVDGDENEFEIEQDLEQNGFEAEVSTDLSQTVSQASAAVFSF